MQEDLPYYVALTKAEGIGPVLGKKLISYCGSAKAVFSVPKTKLLQTPGAGPKTAAAVEECRALLEWAAKEVETARGNGWAMLPYHDKRYPAALNHTADGPLLLFKRGPLDLNAAPAIAIIGTRKPTTYGREQARRFARAFAQRGINVVSGLAYGIDAEAQREVLDAGGVTTAVLAHGLDTVYPAKHAGLSREIADKGALITEYPTKTNPDKHNFPYRNRIMAGMCAGMVVVEAGLKSGTLISAKQAFQADRLVFAVPGPVTSSVSEGCNRLIRDNVAKLVTCPEEALEELNLLDAAEAKAAPVLKPVMQDLSQIEQNIVAYLESRESAGLDQIAEDVGISAGEAVSYLLMLEFYGIVRQAPGRMFSRARA